MAIDPNIALQAGTGAAAPQNPFDMVGKAVGIANAMGENKLLGVRTDTAQQGRSQDAKMWIAQQSLSLYAKATKDPGAAWHDLGRVLQSGVATGRISQSDADQADIYFSAFKNKNELAPAFLRHAMGSLGVTEQINAEAPGITMVGTGGSTVPVGTPSSVDRAFRGAQPPGAITNTMDPTSAATVQTIPEIDPSTGKPTGGTVSMTAAEVAANRGQQGPPGTTPFPPGYGGRTPLGATRPTETQTAISAAATDATKASSDLFRAADAANRRRADLNTMIADLAGLKSTGPGTEGQLRLEAFLQKYAGLGITLTADEIAKGEGFAKVAKTMAAQQASVLGVSSDQRLSNAIGANPSLDLSKRGNNEILAMLKGNEDAIIAKSRAWEDWLKSGKTPDTYNQFQTDFNRRFDPRAFHWANLYPSLSPAERAKYLERMPDKEEFRKAYNEAVRNKWIASPGG